MGAAAARRQAGRLARRSTRPERVILGATVLVVGCLALVPVAYLLWGAFFDGGGLTLSHFRAAYETYGLGSTTANSIAFALGSMAIAVGLGGALAFLVARTDLPLRRLVFVAALVPLIVPGVLYTFAWILLAGPHSGLLTQLLGSMNFDVFSLGGMILVEGLHLSAIVFLLMVAAFRSIDPALEEAAIASGAKPLAVVRRISIRLAAPAIYACILLSIVGALESFEVPVLLGIPGGTWVLTSRIWSAYAQIPASLGQAGAYSCSLLVLTAVGVFLYSRLTRSGRRFETVIGAQSAARRFALGRWRGPAAAATIAYVSVAAVAPLAILLYCSLQPVYTTPSLHGLSTLTLAHYGAALGSGSLQAFENSIALAVGSATVVMLTTSVVAWILVRTRVPGRWVLDAVASLPIAVPGLVLGVALLFVYLRSPIPVYDTLWILLIAYVTRFMPHGVRFASAAMRQLGGELEEASRASGASWWQSFRRVVLPLIAPGLAAGWILVFILSMLELSSSILLYPPGAEVVSVRIWQQLQEGQFAPPAAAGMVLVAVLAILAGGGWRLGARFGLRRLIGE